MGYSLTGIIVWGCTSSPEDRGREVTVCVNLSALNFLIVLLVGSDLLRYVFLYQLYDYCFINSAGSMGAQ